MEFLQCLSALCCEQWIRRRQQFVGGQGAAEPPRRVEARPEREANRARCDGNWWHSGNLKQRAQARTVGLLQLLQALRDQRAILRVTERREVRYRADGNQIEQVFGLD